jgi:hypothetical protein
MSEMTEEDAWRILKDPTSDPSLAPFQQAVAFLQAQAAEKQLRNAKRATSAARWAGIAAAVSAVISLVTFVAAIASHG